MPQFESEFEEKLYAQRQEKLREIADIGQRLGLSAAESVYPNRFPAEGESLEQIPELLTRYDSDAAPVPAEQLETEKPEFAVAGRLMSIRLQGKAGFAHLQQGGKRLQIYVRKDDVGEDIFALYKLLDLGDHIGVRGMLMRTRTGELTLKALPIPNPGGQPRPAISFLSKAMLALPDKYHGLEDVELRYRQRYVDLIMNSGTLAKAEQATPQTPGASAPQNPDILSDPEWNEGEPKDPCISLELPQIPTEPSNVREVFVKRAAILRAIRRFFDARGYLEVETPMMQTIAGGAAARPFKTHHNALDIPLSLRIAPELYLKRLVVGGLDRVYEINRNFRNEGVSTQHNPEFTMLEFYQAYVNYHDLMDLTQALIAYVAKEVNGTTITRFPIPKGSRAGEIVQIDIADWQRLSMREAIRKFWFKEGFDPKPRFEELSSLDGMKTVILRLCEKSERILREVQNEDQRTQTNARQFDQICRGLLRLTEEGNWGKPVALLFELLAEEHLIPPTIIYDFPLAVSPLSKVKPDEPDWVERFEFYIGGFEVGNAFSELNDMADQEARFRAQVAERERGDVEAMAEVDEDYVRALGYGLPPTAGEGIGIDRLTMILTGSRSIRDVILFPLMRPLTKTVAEEKAKEHTHGESAD